jgi:hypothetical protein
MPNIANLGTGGLRPFRFGTRGIMEYEKKCLGSHDIYVAEVLYVGQEGKLVVVTVCRNCDTVHFHEKQVATPHQAAELLMKKEK